jgi:hypothetical protein
MPKPLRILIRQPVELANSAKNLVEVAALAGITVEARSAIGSLSRIVLGGVDHKRGVAFTAEWVDGRTAGADVYRKRATYELVDDERPAHDARRPDPKHKGRTIAMLNRKPQGIGSHRFRYRGGPRLPAHVTLGELVAMLEALR